MDDNLKLYNQVKEVPIAAQKTIAGGRLKGKTDINPMWRIKALTELFGACGVGWKYTITKQWLENGHGGEIAAFANIELHIKVGGEWSEPIPGVGGSMFVAQEKNGLYTSDECFKMAVTDAISVCCKALGFGADIYWEKDSTKYTKPEPPPTEEYLDKLAGNLTIEQANHLFTLANKDSDLIAKILAELGYLSSKEVPASKFELIKKMIKEKL